MRACPSCGEGVPRRRHYCPSCLERVAAPVVAAPALEGRPESVIPDSALVLELMRYGLPTGHRTAITHAGSVMSRRAVHRDRVDYVTLVGATSFERLHLRRDVARFERDGARWRVCCDSEDTALVVAGRRLRVGDNSPLAVGDVLEIGGVHCVVRATGGDDDAAQ